MWNNVIISSIITLTGLIGVVIGLIAMNQYHIMPGYKVKFMFMIIMTMMLFVLINTYLFRQLKSIGMFIMMTTLGVFILLR